MLARAQIALWIQRNVPRLYRAWSRAGARRWRQAETPWAPLRKPVARCRVALINSGGILLRGQEPFDLNDPAGDCSYRVIPGDAELDDVVVSHLFYDSSDVRVDTEVLFPLATLREFADAGLVGDVAPRHFSLSGSIPDPRPLVERSAPQIADLLVADQVDLVLLTPA